MVFSTKKAVLLGASILVAGSAASLWANTTGTASQLYTDLSQARQTISTIIFSTRNANKSWEDSKSVPLQVKNATVTIEGSLNVGPENAATKNTLSNNIENSSILGGTKNKI